MRSLLLTVLAAALFLPAPSGHAHRASDACLQLLVGEQGRVEGRLDVSLRDLAVVVALDPDNDGNVTWGEVKTAKPSILQLATREIRCLADGRPLELTATDLQISDLAGEPAASIVLKGVLPENIRGIEVDYQLLFATDPEHRGFLRIQNRDRTEAFVLSPQQPRARFALAGGTDAPAQPMSFSGFVREGVHHIAIGFDHLLFLFALLLPAVLRREETGRYVAVEELAPVVRNTLAVVTAFTVSHSITLAIAALEWVNPPSRWVETAIAASVALAAINNLAPFFRDRSWMIAGVFGLIHGFGFAGVLKELSLPRGQFATGLLGFNLGVELGQVAILALFLPIAFALRGGWLYRRVVLQAGSSAIVLVATAWMAQRAFDLAIPGW